VCLKELVDNALDACETAGVAPEVRVEVEKDVKTLRLTVSDNGPAYRRRS
jgi:DNA topoisomerase VI subunit B